MFIPKVGDYISVRKGGQSAAPFDLAGTVRSVVYTEFEGIDPLLSVTFENSSSAIFITVADEVQVH